jgi:hypothetical protein
MVELAGRAQAGRVLKKTSKACQEVTRIADEHRGGDPMGKRKYVRCSLRFIAKRIGNLSHETVRHLLKGAGYALRVNVKRLSGKSHPDRDSQFRHIRKKRKQFQKKGCPTISVDTKKTELIGNFKNDGALWSGEPDEVSMYDFPSDAQCRAIPYGVYDTSRNEGHVCVGTKADTPKFAVNSIRNWWRCLGHKHYPHSTDLFIEADGGGSNGYRPRLWKYELQQFANETGMKIHVCHYPPGASKWNPIEHRLFGPISMNWSGQPLRSIRLMLSAIRGTTNQGDLSVTAEHDRRKYKTKIKVDNEQMNLLKLARSKVRPDWNYTISPQLKCGQ